MKVVNIHYPLQETSVTADGDCAYPEIGLRITHFLYWQQNNKAKLDKLGLKNLLCFPPPKPHIDSALSCSIFKIFKKTLVH